MSLARKHNSCMSGYIVPSGSLARTHHSWGSSDRRHNSHLSGYNVPRGSLARTHNSSRSGYNVPCGCSDRRHNSHLSGYIVPRGSLARTHTLNRSEYNVLCGCSDRRHNSHMSRYNVSRGLSLSHNFIQSNDPPSIQHPTHPNPPPGGLRMDASATGYYLISQSRAPSSGAVTKSAWSVWRDFCMTTSHSDMLVPANAGGYTWQRQDHQLVSFVGFMHSRRYMISTMRTYMSQVEFVHKSHWGFKILIQYYRFRAALSGSGRVQAALGIFTKGRELLTMDMLAHSMHLLRPKTYHGKKMAALIALGITCGFRISVLVMCAKTNHTLRRQDITVTIDAAGVPVRIQVYIRFSKGVIIPTTRAMVANGAATCAVALMDTFLKAANAPATGVLFPFVNTSTVTNAIKAIARHNGRTDITNFGSQSMRKGAGTTFCSGGDIEAHVLKKHTRWRSDIYADTYQTITPESEWHLAQKLIPSSINGTKTM